MKNIIRCEVFVSRSLNRSSFSSTNISTDAKSTGGKIDDISTTILINLGSFLLGYDGVS